MYADKLAVVVNPNNPHSLSSKELYRLFFGKSSSFSNGSRAIPLVFSSDNAQLAVFAKEVLGRSSNQLRSYWAKQVFTGKGNPPLEVSSVDEMKQLVSSNIEYVGYLWLSDVDDSVMPILIVDGN